MADPNAKIHPPMLGTVSVGALAAALGTTRSSIIRAIKALEIPDAERRTHGNHRRWETATAAAIVRKAGRPVPAAWGSP
jgi:hypothetical protein